MRIVLDGMGSDNFPTPEAEAALQAARAFGDELILVGNRELLQPALARAGAGPDTPIRLVHASEVLEMGDKPARAARGKADNSMAVGMDLLKRGEADAFVTAGNTGAAMATALFQLGRLRGVRRPGLTALFPVKNGHTVVLDIGANADCKPEYLLQFAIMGSVYAERALGIAAPRVGLLSNGEEAGKGNELVKAAYPLLAGAGLNFIGNVEGKELFGGQADVVVTDGFTGNVLLKSSEAVAKLLTEIIREEITANLITALGGVLARPAFRKVRRLLDPAEVGAAPLLGVNGLLFVGHGRSDARALVNAVRAARQAVAGNVLDSLRRSLAERLGSAGSTPEHDHA